GGRTPGRGRVELSIGLALPTREVDPASSGSLATPSPPAPDEDEVRRAAALLTATDARPLLYVGLGAQAAQAELVALAEWLQAPVATTIQGKGVFPESHPLFLWNGFG